MFETLTGWAARLAIRIVGLDAVLVAAFTRMAAEGISVTVTHVGIDAGGEDDEDDGDRLDPNIWPLPPGERHR